MAIEIILEPCDKALMENMLTSGQIKHKYAVRVQAVLNRAAGKPANMIAGILCISAGSVKSFAKAFEGEVHDRGKQYTKGIEGSNCRLRH